MTNRQVITARIIVESSTESNDRTMGYVVSAHKNACKNIHTDAAMIVLYDEDERIIGVDVSGVPSDDLAEVINDTIDKYAASVDQNRPVPKPKPPRAV